MADPYEAPSAELREDLPPRRYLHPIIGAMSGLVAALALIFTPPYPPHYVQSLLLVIAGSVATGAFLLLFRNLRWYFALLAGPPITIAVVFIGALVALQFGLVL